MLLATWQTSPGQGSNFLNFKHFYHRWMSANVNVR
jgi:hypothetical protein